MYTQCPQCLTVFLLDAAILGAGRGDVRCGKCGELFSALDAIADEPPGDGIVTPTFPSQRPPMIRPPGDERTTDVFHDLDELLRQVEEEEELEAGATGDMAAHPATDLDVDAEAWEEEEDEAEDLRRSPLPADLGEPEPSDEDHPDELLAALPTVRASRPRSTGRGWRLGAFVLLIGLVAQAAWYERDWLLNDDTARGWLTSACNLVGCELPLRRDLAAIRLASRDIRPHPSVEGALIINATLHNQAAFRQPYPEVVIRLSNLEGRPVAARRFAPAEYLERPSLGDAGMAPETLVPLVFEVVDPGDDAVAFEFDFR